MEHREKREQLREAYLDALEKLTKIGGFNPDVGETPEVTKCRIDFHAASDALISHRVDHGC